MTEAKEMTNVEKLEIKLAELRERGVTGFNVSDYSGLMGIAPEAPEDKAGSILSMIACAEDPDAWVFRTYTGENGEKGFELKCRDCKHEYRILDTDKTNRRMICPECGKSNAM